MGYENFMHNDPDVYHDKELTLHDCVAEKILFENGILRFDLPDGFWVTPYHKENKCEKTVRTGASAVEFTVKDVEDITVWVFTRSTRRWSRKTSVEIWSVEKLISAVNSGKCTLEFITQYRNRFEQMWHCAVNSKKKPYYSECLLHLPETEATFRWNELCPSREW